MDATTRPPSSSYSPPIPKRYIRPVERDDAGELFLNCKCGVVFTPKRIFDRLRRGGFGALPCKACGTWLMLVGGDGYGVRVAETHPVELAWFTAEGWDDIAKLLYALDNPVRDGKS